MEGMDAKAGGSPLPATKIAAEKFIFSGLTSGWIKFLQDHYILDLRIMSFSNNFISKLTSSTASF